MLTAKDREALRIRYKPEKVRILFVGESPPASGNFFYLKTVLSFRTRIGHLQRLDLRGRVKALADSLGTSAIVDVISWISSNEPVAEACAPYWVGRCARTENLCRYLGDLAKARA